MITRGRGQNLEKLIEVRNKANRQTIEAFLEKNVWKIGVDYDERTIRTNMAMG